MYILIRVLILSMLVLISMIFSFPLEAAQEMPPAPRDCFSLKPAGMDAVVDIQVNSVVCGSEQKMM